MAVHTNINSKKLGKLFRIKDLGRAVDGILVLHSNIRQHTAIKQFSDLQRFR